MPLGYCKRILKVDLSTKKISVEEPNENFYRKYFGGEALIAYYLLKELRQGIDPFSPNNLLIFSAGVLTGHPFSGSGRNSVGTKSPLTGGFGTSEAGGYWGSELKKAGYDALVLKGCSDKPSYLWIDNRTVEIREANHLWGKTTGDVEIELKKELGQDIRITQIGPAGERMVRYACIINDLSHVAGRTGMGAVMGSKRLKLIAVRGMEPVKISDPNKVNEIARKNLEKTDFELPVGRTISDFRKTGTGATLLILNELGSLPTKNFQTGRFEFAEEISGERMANTILTGRHTCYGCIIGCKRAVKLGEPYNIDSKYGGPEYETLASFGSNCGINNLNDIAKANELCNAYGLDTISAGSSIAFIMECFEKGLITEQNTDGLCLKFGCSKAMLKMLDKIIMRQGIGRLLGEGVKKTAHKIGKEAEKFALHIKGQEIPMHEPRIKKTLGIGYAVSPTGADHCHNIHDSAFQGWSKNMKEIQALGILEPLPPNSLNHKNIRLLVYGSNWRHFTNCAVICLFTPWLYENTPSLVNAITGWNSTTWELMKVGERAATMGRIFNIREGFVSEDDCLPDRFFQPFEFGPKTCLDISKEEVDRWKKVYYKMMGWDEDGIPTYEKLYELDIGWTAGLLHAR